MLKIHKNIFDKKWLDEISFELMQESWIPNNIANRNTWPYGLKGTHLLFGNNYFRRIDNNFIEYGNNKKITNTLINSFNAIQNKIRKEMELLEISTNLQFQGMDGTLHKDGIEENLSVFILMISNELITENIGGEFYHQPTNTSVPYEYGKVIEQSGTDLHRGFAFKKPYTARMSIKYVGKIK